MRYKFGFTGGVKKHTSVGTTSKFLLFHLIPSVKAEPICEEKIFFHSLKNGYTVDTAALLVDSLSSGLQAPDPFSAQQMRYTTDYPDFKVFTLVEGFGIQRQFYSFYLTLDIHASLTTILPLCKEQQDHLFVGRFRFTAIDRVKELLGGDSVSYLFYKKQLPLAKSILNRIVIVGQGQEAGPNPAAVHIVRMVRL